jgi:hypothetical protein
MLNNFLDQELSETHLGIPTGIRAHLERFRSFLLSFYSTKLGYYPPRSIDGSVCRAMAKDFRALYDLLVDEAYNSSEAMPPTAAGGLCTLQLVQSLDTRCRFEPMNHPLPKLPQADQQLRNKRMSWLPRSPRQRADDRQLAHVSLVNASNWEETSFQNSLVQAYRKFEESCAVASKRVDKSERVSLVDGRKIRWILIYAVHQTLRYATQRPPGVQDDAKATYLLSIAKNTLPPWEKRNPIEGLIRSQTEPALSRLTKLDHEEAVPAVERFEIKPDIDYFALTHKEDACSPTRARRASLPPSTERPTTLSRASSFKQVLSRSSTIRRSMRRLKKGAKPPLSEPVPPSPSRYHEIVVHGYGNGTNDVHLEDDAILKPPSPDVGRSASTASETPSSNISTVPSSASMAETLESSLNSPILPESPIEKPAKARRWSHYDTGMVNSSGLAASSPNVLSKSNSLRRRPISSALEGYNYAAKAFGQFVDNERRSIFAGGRPNTELKRKASNAQIRPMPVPIREDDIVEEPYVLPRDSGDWTAMQEFLDGKGAGEAGSHAWEQYADLGGLTEAGLRTL